VRLALRNESSREKSFKNMAVVARISSVFVIVPSAFPARADQQYRIADLRK
jgi:hypothetical protein